MDVSVPRLSVVVPVFNEEDVLPLFAQRMRPVLDALDLPYEVLTVDDGSRDATPAVLEGMRRQWPQLRVVRLRRNSGHQNALTAGLHRARGQYVVSIDVDLQDPPEVIAEMLHLAESAGLDVVHGVRADRSSDSRFKRWTAGMYYRLVRRVVGASVPHNAGDFRLLSRTAVDALIDLPEHEPVYRLLVPWLGLPGGEVTYTRERRAAGRSKYPLAKMVRLALDSVTGFSAAPLRVATWLGCAGIALCVAIGGAALAAYLWGTVVPGWTSMFVALMFVGALQLLCLGLLGEYVARIFTTLQGRPPYVVTFDSAATGRPLVETGKGSTPWKL
ncbi:glycosyltransferase family 2 protein [Actinoplanes xinjiangensis]|jgi:glycosyltransferase involved in cell wall biosynthesis|uniref:Dolichol-phosphate mannosyltransferase n=1 Tax=Actinoplanes xinjiangensis TaxID=512350 RepID=A0A316FKB1_9ACTN|nr:glycosyltransferase family 2 protein [Actinoplanes xinjiangensis]PWK48220.1 dolichol-phosphate mannosyltransferase [Actinoplanes xinjiangensis]GIF39025.1 glucosyl transferase [Actinoplanes xinjiangensis]